MLHHLFNVTYSQSQSVGGGAQYPDPNLHSFTKEQCVFVKIGCANLLLLTSIVHTSPAEL